MAKGAQYGRRKKVEMIESALFLATFKIYLAANIKQFDYLPLSIKVGLV